MGISSCQGDLTNGHLSGSIHRMESLPLGARYSIWPGQTLPENLQQAVISIPGTHIRTRRGAEYISVPADGAWIVGNLLKAVGEPYTAEVDLRGVPPDLPRSPEQVRTRLLESELRGGLWDDWFLDYQKAGVTQLGMAGGGHLWWKPGAGKTAGAIAWALTRRFDARTSTGAILTVTKASVRHRWGREITKLSHVRPWVSDPDDRRRSSWRSLDDYLRECWAFGRRPWVVVGWEELATLVYGEDAHEVAGTRHDRPEARVITPEEALYLSSQQVQGVGAAMADALVEEFGSIEGLQAAPVESIRAVPGVGDRTLLSLLAARHYLVPQAPIDQVHQALKKYKFDTVVYDELHTGKNRKRKQWVVDTEGNIKGHDKRNTFAAAEWVSRRAKMRLGTTATPIPNRMRDLWGLLDLVQPWQFGGYWKFAKRHCGAQQGEFGMTDDGSSNEVELTYRLGVIGSTGERVMKDNGTAGDVAPPWAYVSQVPASLSHGQLPDKRREVERVTFAQQARGDSDAFKDIRRAKDAKSRMEAALEWACTKKRPRVLEHVEEVALAGGKVIVFTGRIHDAERTHAAVVKKFGKRLGAGAIWLAHGGHSTHDRDIIAQQFLAHSGGCVLVATGYSMGTGIDLQDCDLLIMAMLPGWPELLEQWEGRVSRHGQKRPVRVLYLIAEGTADEHVADGLIDKLPAVVSITGQQELHEAGEDLLGSEDSDAVLDGILARFCQTQPDLVSK
ncbi:MAG TPA: hypothetical protein EYF98_15670 [Planctomycetes bacterium]|nr:hypothetical protein [Planctomycetota bacterium]